MSDRPYVQLLRALDVGVTEPAKPAFSTQPTADQIARFAKLSVEERFRWLVDTLVLCHELATPEVRAQWRKHKSGGI